VADFARFDFGIERFESFFQWSEVAILMSVAQLPEKVGAAFRPM